MKHGMANGLLLPGTCEVSLIRTPLKAETIAKAFRSDIRNSDSQAAIQIVVEAVRAFTAQFDLISELADEKSILEKKIKNYAEIRATHIRLLKKGSVFRLKTAENTFNTKNFASAEEAFKRLIELDKDKVTSIEVEPIVIEYN